MPRMNKRITTRIIIDILLAIFVLNGWWFFALILGLFGAWYMPYFVEAIIAGIIYDALFGAAAGMGLWGYMGTIIGVVVFVLLRGLKKAVRR